MPARDTVVPGKVNAPIEPRRRYVTVACKPSEVADALESHPRDYELTAMTSHQVGTGFGAHIEVLLAFRLKATANEPD